jgi:hypothetical protein
MFVSLDDVSNVAVVAVLRALTCEVVRYDRNALLRDCSETLASPLSPAVLKALTCEETIEFN